MKVIAVFKWSRNPQDALVKADGSVEWPGVKMSANDDDPAVMEIAKTIAAGDEIIGLTIGDGDISWAAARGATRTVVITDALTEANSSLTGSVLAAAIRRIEDAVAVVIGDSSWDYGVVSALTGQLGRTSVAGIVEVKIEQGRLLATRKMGSVSQVLQINGPVVLGVAASREEQNAPSMKEVIMSRKKPVERLTLADLNLPVLANTVSRGSKFPAKPPAHIIDGADPAKACEELLAALHTEGVI